MSPEDRARFDRLFDRVVRSLPGAIIRLTDEVPIIVEDRPHERILRQMAAPGEPPLEPDELCGLHTGVAFTERSIDHADLPSDIVIFREGIVAAAGGFAKTEDDDEGVTAEDIDDAVAEEIRVTILHEVGHQFGLSEEDLERLGYE